MTGSSKGSTSKVILHRRGTDTLRYNGNSDDYPKDFKTGPSASVWKRIPR
jgi:hypothetical protein